MNTNELQRQIEIRNTRCDEIEIAFGQSKVGDGTYNALASEKRAIVDELEVLLNELHQEPFSAQIDEARISAARQRVGL